MTETTRTTARARRRFARRQWSRRWLAWRPLLVVVLVLALVGGGTWLVYFSPHLVVGQTRVEGIEQLRQRQVLRVADVPEGRPLARVDVGRMEDRVRTLSVVKDVAISRGWPDTLVIEITERQAIAVVEVGSTLRGMDEEGTLYRAYEDAPEELPRVITPGDTRSEALAEAAAVLTALPADLLGIVDHLEVRTVDQIGLVLDDGRRVEWGSAEESAEKARVLPALLDQDAQVYDVSVPGQPTTS